MAYQSSPRHVDFISNLPPEIILEILVSVRIKDVLSCMCVCREWYVRLRHLQAYWNIALNRLGLPPHMRTNVTTQQSTLMVSIDNRESVDWFTLAVQAWRGREYISSSAPEVAYVSAQYRQYFQCNYCRHGTLVATLYQDFIPLATFIYKIQPGSKRLVTKNRFAPTLDSPQGRVCWVSVYCDYLLMATACGRWQGYSLTTNAKLLDWSGPELYDQEVVTCCCQYCFLVVLVKPVSQRRYLGIKESYWEIQVITLGRGYSNPTIYNYSIPTSYNIPPSMVNYGCKHSALISSSSLPGGTSVKDVFCSSHLLLLQWANCVTIYGVDKRLCISSTPVKILSDNDATTTAMYSLSSLTVMREVVQAMQHCNSSFIVSSDNALIGFIFSDKLHVWSLRDGFQHESTIDLQPHRGSDNAEHYNSQVHLLAVGHLYSLIGFGSIDGQLKVICTYTGKCVFSTHGFSGISTKESLQVVGTPPPYFSYLGVVDEHWLSNIDTRPPSTIPIILYWMKKEQGVFGIIFKHGIQNIVTSEELTEAGNRSSEQTVNVIYGSIQSRIHNLYKKFF